MHTLRCDSFAGFYLPGVIGEMKLTLNATQINQGLVLCEGW